MKHLTYAMKGDFQIPQLKLYFTAEQNTALYKEQSL